MKKKAPSAEMIAKASERLRALADEVRIRILIRLKTVGECNVSTLVEEFAIAQASVSKHLAVLRQVGFVKVRRDGAQSLYSIRDETAFDIIRIIFDGVHRHQTETAHAIGLEAPDYEI